jgi:ATP-dependent protease ClpP protease subunit
MQLGYDFENRALFLFGEIDAGTAYRFIAGFKWLDRTPGPIHVLLSSPGGGTDSGIAIYETIRTANNPTIVEGLGIVASAAVPVLLAGTVRFLNPSTRVMIHNISFEIDGTLSTPEAKYISMSAEHFNQWYHGLIAERTGAKPKDIEKWCSGETSFAAEEAVKLGFSRKSRVSLRSPRKERQGSNDYSTEDSRRHRRDPTRFRTWFRHGYVYSTGQGYRDSDHPRGQGSGRSLGSDQDRGIQEDP